MFHFPRLASEKNQISRYNPWWVSSFGNVRIKAYCQLPEPYRRLSRPSSLPWTKASTTTPLNFLLGNLKITSKHILCVASSNWRWKRTFNLFSIVRYVELFSFALCENTFLYLYETQHTCNLHYKYIEPHFSIILSQDNRTSKTEVLLVIFLRGMHLMLTKFCVPKPSKSYLLQPAWEICETSSSIYEAILKSSVLE